MRKEITILIILFTMVSCSVIILNHSNKNTLNEDLHPSLLPNSEDIVPSIIPSIEYSPTTQYAVDTLTTKK